MIPLKFPGTSALVGHHDRCPLQNPGASLCAGYPLAQGLAWPCRESKALSTNVHNPRIQKESSWSPQPSLTKEEQNRNGKEVVGGGNKVSHPSLTPMYRTILAAPVPPLPGPPCHGSLLPGAAPFCPTPKQTLLSGKDLAPFFTLEGTVCPYIFLLFYYQSCPYYELSSEKSVSHKVKKAVSKGGFLSLSLLSVFVYF